jgi:hypothetical protein
MGAPPEPPAPSPPAPPVPPAPLPLPVDDDPGPVESSSSLQPVSPIDTRSKEATP